MATFTKTYAERGLIEAAAQGDRYAKGILDRQRNKSQRDVLEGTIASIPPSRAKEFPAEMREVMCTDVMIRALGYNYCNVMCFCKMEYRQQIFKEKMSIDWNETNMKDFGEYAIIVKNPKVGQEIENAKFIRDKGIGILYDTDEDLKELIKDLVNKKLDSRLIFMDKNISEFKKTIHPDKIADYIFQLLENN